MDVIWSLVLEEGRGGFMDASKYREVMTGLFFHGTAPEPTAKPGPPGQRSSSPPRKSKIDELRAFNEAIAARNNPTE